MNLCSTPVLAGLALTLFCQPLLRAGVAFPDPGWTYIYEGAAATNAPPGSGFVSLDGTWSHDNASDEWDGSPIGGELGELNIAGGITNIVEGTNSFLRIQDPGDPRDHGFFDPGSNRKIYFGHNVSERGLTNAILDDGFTLSFRARIPTNAPIDELHTLRDGSPVVEPYPAGGDGHLISDAGRGFISVAQANGGIISFSLNTTNDFRSPDDPTPAGFAGMTLNEWAGNFPSIDVDFGQGAGTNRLTFDPTAWHEFWIVIRADPEGLGTHEVFIYMDGATNSQSFKVTASPELDFFEMNYIGIGTPSSPQSSAFDLDFVAYKNGAEPPPGAGPLPQPEPAGPIELTAPALTNGVFSFTFTAEAGRTYRAEFVNSLSETNWTTLTTLSNTSPGATNVVDTTPTSNQRFYRVVSE